MGIQAACPGCGAPIEFGLANSLVVVCESCQSLVGRADGHFDDYGKVAQLADIASPLAVGVQGTHRGKPFVVTGRIQIEHAGGGTWNEWYLAFRDGQSWAWLAENQGNYSLTFRKKVPGQAALPHPDTLDIGEELAIPTAGRMRVVEIGQATTIAAEGELPCQPRPGEAITYADLSGSAGKVATLDGSNSRPVLYLGRAVTLEQLGLGDRAAAFQKQAQTAAIQVDCPSCAAPLTVQQPDQSLRVTCGTCGALHDCNRGHLAFLAKLDQPEAKPRIPLGATGTLAGRRFTVLGFLQRQVTWQGTVYPWQEYLLSCPGQPFHWLIESDGHWSLGCEIPAGPINYRPGARRIVAEGRSYRLYEKSVPQAVTVLGEFYWKVEVGEKVQATDYIAPPWSLSRETSHTTDGRTWQQLLEAAKPAAAERDDLPQPTKPLHRMNRGELIRFLDKAAGKSTTREVHYTVARYIPHHDVAKAFSANIPAPAKTGRIQPNPHLTPSHMCIAAGLLIAALMVVLVTHLSAPRRLVKNTSIAFASASPRNRVYRTHLGTFSPPDQAITQYSEPFRLNPGQNIRIRCRAKTVNNSWAYVDGHLYNEGTGVVVPFGVEMSYYHGVDGGESWSEGSLSSSVFLSAVPAGTYSLRLSAQRSSPKTASIGVEIHQGVPSWTTTFLLLGAVLALVAYPVCRWYMFEAARWSDSDYSPYSSSS
ncbi:MAG: DUF4178 domain-containing protein [Planctomycetota bacterium]|nr:DUF4178 domain-containing protein [Planctomycetota bacterium]